MSLPIFDAHFHIIDPRFPLIANQGYLPPAFSTSDYAQVRPANVLAGAVVSGSFQAFDQSYLVDALEQLGPTYVGVTQLPHTVTDAEILELDRRGVRAVRFNLHRGGSEGIDQLVYLAQRVHELAGWHVEFYADAFDLAEVMPLLTALPQIVVDHVGLSERGLPTLLKLVEAGAKVKASGFGRVTLELPAALRAVAAIDPHALIFGTDLPSTRAPRPFLSSDIELVLDTLGERDGRRALYENALALYRPRSLPAALHAE